MSGGWPPPTPPPGAPRPQQGSPPDPAWPPPTPQAAPPPPGSFPLPTDRPPAYPPPAPGQVYAPGPEKHPAEPLEYHVLHRRGRPGWAWGLLGIPVMLVLVFVVVPLVAIVPFVAWYVVADDPVADSLARLVDVTDPTPASLAYINISLALAIPVVWLLTRVLHGLTPRWVTSVRPRMRWAYFAICLVLSVAAMIATIVVAFLLPAPAEGAEVGGQLNEFTSTTRDFLLVVLLLTPFQAAAEEYAFRGYLTQAVGGMVDGWLGRWVGRVLAVVVPALLFAMLHGLGQDAPVFLDRFAFGVVAGILVIATGGLEAAIAMHIVNNFVAFGLALAFGDLGSSLVPTGGTWWMVPTTLTQSVVYLVLAWGVARLMGLSRYAEESVLVASRGLVYRDGPARAEYSGRV